MGMWYVGAFRQDPTGHLDRAGLSGRRERVEKRCALLCEHTQKIPSREDRC